MSIIESFIVPHPPLIVPEIGKGEENQIQSNRRGLLLPNLEGVDTPEQQIQIALSKAGIKENEKYSIERFEVIRHR